jgi:RES domain-containing protein
VSYAAESLALATLEKIGGVGRLDRLNEMMYVPADLQTTTIELLEENDLPEGWDRRPPGTASRVVGDRWLEEERSVALRVPSVTLPEESNFVLNPAHPEFIEALAPRAPSPLELDPRIMDRLQE